ncbi:MAG: polysaccharide biosynthesis tyrosine autokinase [Melioribacteraceae bacterium]|nr:polysaccharide biosynthesis tyrosine autokinase [Melioribacteraceae bacterium]MCF8355434.1 polysaccharide biosynthesis tyrosine autokinase [Melioribacteraceae bacterium]MCF8395369.1 polysaccharide biosynthesis tyrosine autokinase [Melioribacteraceae bacterium]MCF8420462.1 polysaccharide biosynthesis tyrosine autokinase [Melioribacteraceae bacterium]
MENYNLTQLRDEETNTLKDYINLVRLHIVPIVIIGLSALIVSIIYAMNAQDIYTSTTVIKLSKPQGNILESPLLPEFSDFGSDRFIANEIEILKSYTNRENVAKSLIDTFNVIGEPDSFYLILNQDFLENSQTNKIKSKSSIAGMLNSKVAIEQKRGLDIVEISVESPSPFEAALIANVYADEYWKLNLSYNRQQLINVKRFLKSQREEKLNELELSENKLKKYQEEKGIVVLSEQASSLIQQVTDFESKMNATQIELTITEKNLEQLKTALRGQDEKIAAYIESFATESYLKGLQTEIAALEVQRDRAIANSNETANEEFILKKFEKNINDLKKKLDSKIKIFKAGIFASSPEEVQQLSQQVLETEIKYNSLLASFTELDKIVADYERRFNQLPSRTLELARLERERVATEKLYLLVEEKYQEALINEQSTPGNVIIIDPARVPELPSKPNRMLIILVGLVLGLGMGFGYAFARSYFDNTVKTPEDIQKKNINVLAWIPQIDGVQADNREFEFIVSKKPDSIPAEAFRALRTRIHFSKIGTEGIHTILVTSSAPREGKTTVTVNLAGSFALANKKSVIVDCDLRKPRVHNVFNVNKTPGFTDYFFGQADFKDILRKSDVDNLYYITAGTIPPNPSEILRSTQMEQFLATLKEQFDLVLLDSPPIIAVTDSEILSRLVDATILVVSANITEIDLMQKATELLSHDQGSFIGVLLNNFSYRSGYGSYYKYYYYYSRGTKQKSKG